MPIRKSRMISFRLSEDEYEALKGSCSQSGARSVSDLARSAMHEFLGNGRNQSDRTFQSELERLNGRVSMLDRAVERLAQLVSADKA
ncbi:MAG TPA: hypothetical protein VN428_16565 [Bryobacteraceae bacterium]|nr:hypothetical protein [Bryobacteraceae bacterium]